MKFERNRWLYRTAIPVVFTLALVGLLTPLYFFSGGPQVVTGGFGVLAAGRNTFTISNPVLLAEHPRVLVRSGTISIKDSEPAAKQARGSVVRRLVAGTARLTLKHAVIEVDLRDAKAVAAVGHGMDHLEPLAPLVRALQRLATVSLTLSNVKLKLRGKNGFAKTFDIVSAQLSSSNERSITVVGQVSHGGETAEFDVDVVAPDPKTDAASPALNLRLSLKSRLLDADIDGRLDIGVGAQVITGETSIDSNSIGEALSWLGLNWPAALPVRAFRASGKLDWTTRAISLQDADFSLEGNSGRGTLSLSPGGQRPSIDATVAMDSLDLTPYLNAGASVLRTAGRNESVGTDFGRDWLRVLKTYAGYSGDYGTALRGLDADLRISANSVMADGIRFKNCAATVSLKEGKLLADFAELTFVDGGNGSLQVSLDVSEKVPRMGLRGRLEQVEISSAADRLFSHAIILGKANVMLDLATHGLVHNDLTSNLNGNIDIDIPYGGVLGVDLAALITRADPAASNNAETGWGKSGRGVTKLNKIAVRLDVSHGTISLAQANAMGGGTRVSATGEAFIPTRTIDVKVWVGPEAPGRAPQAGAPSEGGRVIGDLISLRGRWDAPSISVSSRPDEAAGKVEPQAKEPPPQRVPRRRIDEGGEPSRRGSVSSPG